MVNETPNVRCSWEFDNDRKHRTKTSPLQVFVNVHVLAGIRSLVNLVRKAAVRREHVRGGQAGSNPLVSAPRETFRQQ